MNRLAPRWLSWCLTVSAAGAALCGCAAEERQPDPPPPATATPEPLPGRDELPPLGTPRAKIPPGDVAEPRDR